MPFESDPLQFLDGRKSESTASAVSSPAGDPGGRFKSAFSCTAATSARSSSMTKSVSDSFQPHAAVDPLQVAVKLRNFGDGLQRVLLRAVRPGVP